MTKSSRVDCSCCIVGGGPAGILCGFLLARKGVKVVILEKHEDFFRDFRGDTIHPSTLEVMHELGLLEDFLQLPHQKLYSLNINFGSTRVPVADFSHLPLHCKYIVFMPQWNFLNFLADQGKKYPQFDLRMNTAACDLIEDEGRIKGVRAKSLGEDVEIYADLVIAADGRQSILRKKAGLKVIDLGVPIDVLWLKIPKERDSSERALGYFGSGKMMVLLNRGEYFQCGFIIKKGSLDAIKAQGIDAFREDIVSLAPFLGDSVTAIQSWDEIKLLTVAIDRLETWYRPGLLCIGDAAHAMSPAGGVGINLAIQDAIAAANILTDKLLHATVSESDLKKVQNRRLLPTKFYQAIQHFIHTRFFPKVLAKTSSTKLPLAFRLLQKFPFLRRIPARLIGMGIRPEHIKE